MNAFWDVSFKWDGKTYPANGLPTCKLCTTYLMKFNCVNNIYSAVNLWAVYTEYVCSPVLARTTPAMNLMLFLRTSHLSNSRRILFLGRWYMSKVSVLKIFHGILDPATLILPLIILLYCTISCENNLDLCFLRLRFFHF